MDNKLPGQGRDEELRRTSRVLQIILMISSAPQRYTRKRLAEHFEVSEKTINNDLAIIRHGLRLPIEHTRQGYYFEKTPNLPALQYNFVEALALLKTVQAAQQMSGTGSSELAAAIARLEALFPPEFVPLLRQTPKPLPMTAQREHRQQMHSLLNRALLYRNKIRITYETRSREGAISVRVVHPYTIMPYVRSWQLIAYCENRQAVIMFKIDRIHEATILPDTTYQVSPGFNADNYIGNVWGIMRIDGPAEEVDLHFDEQAGRWVSEEFWHKSQRVEVQADGTVIFRLTIVITPEFVNWLLYYGSRVEVLGPAHLRLSVVEEHRKAAGIYKNELGK